MQREATYFEIIVGNHKILQKMDTSNNRVDHQQVANEVQVYAVIFQYASLVELNQCVSTINYKLVLRILI